VIASAGAPTMLAVKKKRKVAPVAANGAAMAPVAVNAAVSSRVPQAAPSCGLEARSAKRPVAAALE